MIQDAARIAAHQHRNQTRKYTGEPYIVHPMEVAGTIQSLGFSEEVVAAAWLHDVIEDTDYPARLLPNEFGDTVTRLVWEVTDEKNEKANRAKRKTESNERLSKVSYEGQSIKLADLMSNTKDIVPHDPKFAKIYLAEKRQLLTVMTGGHPALRQIVLHQLTTAETALGIS